MSIVKSSEILQGSTGLLRTYFKMVSLFEESLPHTDSAKDSCEITEQQNSTK